MGRPRKWESDAERMRAKRLGPVPEDVVDEVPLEPLPQRRPMISEEEYVRRELEVTRHQMRHRDDLRERLARSERYLRDRYRGFLEGEVASL